MSYVLRPSPIETGKLSFRNSLQKKMVLLVKNKCQHYLNFPLIICPICGHVNAEDDKKVCQTCLGTGEIAVGDGINAPLFIDCQTCKGKCYIDN